MADVVRLSYAPADETGGTNVLKYNTDYQDLSQKIITTNAIAGISKVTLRLKKAGTPTGNLTLKLETDSGGNPSNTTVTNGTSNTVDVSTLTTSYADYDFTFASEPSLSASTTYHIVLNGSYATSIANHALWSQDGTASATGGAGKREDTVPVWTAVAGSFWHKIWGDPLPFVPKVLII